MLLSLPWLEIAVLMVTVLVLTLYGFAVSGHFPMRSGPEHAPAPVAAAIVWVTLAIAVASVILIVLFVLKAVPVHAAVIGSGLAILAGPHLLRPVPNRIADGHGLLLALSLVVIALDAAMWRLMS